MRLRVDEFLAEVVCRSFVGGCTDGILVRVRCKAVLDWMSLVKDGVTTFISTFSLFIMIDCEISEKFGRSAMLPGLGSVMSFVILMLGQGCCRIDELGDELFTGIDFGEPSVPVKRRLGLLPNVCSVGRERLEGYLSSSMQILLEPRLRVRENEGKSSSSVCFFSLALRPSGLVRPASYTQNILTYRRPNRKEVFFWTEQSQIPMISPSCIHMPNEMPQRFS